VAALLKWGSALLGLVTAGESPVVVLLRVALWDGR
jgi:hypothetical protein